MNVCIDVEHDCGPEFYTEKLVRARKRWLCGECGEAIEPGELHEHIKGRWEGHWSEHRTCARCVNVRNDFFRSWSYGLMVQDFMDVHSVDYRDGIPSHITPCGHTGDDNG